MASTAEMVHIVYQFLKSCLVDVGMYVAPEAV